MSENIKSLAMIKMEKNFRAVIDKGKPRDPYEYFSTKQLLEKLDEEVSELKEAISSGIPYAAMLECGDISNVIDIIFEKLVKKRLK